ISSLTICLTIWSYWTSDRSRSMAPWARVPWGRLGPCFAPAELRRALVGLDVWGPASLLRSYAGHFFARGARKKMAGTTGLEPATSDVTGRRSNQLNYVPALGGPNGCEWWAITDSNRGPSACKADALTN